MPLGSDLERALRRAGLRHCDLSAVARQLNDIQEVSGRMSAVLSGAGALPSLRVDDPIFGVNNFLGAFVGYPPGPDQSIPDSTQTQLEFGSYFARTPSSDFLWSSAQPARLVWATPGVGPIWIVAGTVVFAANATGQRSVVLSSRNSAGTAISGQTMNQLTGNVTGSHTVLNYAVWWRKLATEHHLTLDVIQKSGGALDVTYFSMVGLRIQ